MQLLINTSGYEFRVAGMPKPRPDYKDKDKQATTRDGLLAAPPGPDRRE